MRKAFIAFALAFAFVGTAQAASTTDIEFTNGDVTIDGKGGTTANVELRIVVGVGEVVEWVQTNVAGGPLSPVDHRVGGQLGLQEGTHFVTVPVKFPPNTGTYDLEVQTAGVFGGIRAINGNDSVNGFDPFGGALRTVANGSTTGNVGGDDDEELTGLAALIAQIEALVAKLTNPVPPAPVPTKPACPPAYLGYNRVEVQGWLMTHGYAGGFNAVGLYTAQDLMQQGIIWGEISKTAYNAALAACR